MRRWSYLIIMLWVLMVGLVRAQQPPVANINSRFEWDQPATNIAEASTNVYRFYLDNSSTAGTFTTVSCSGVSSPFVCTAPVPLLQPGNHIVQLTASNSAGESDKSDPFGFSFVEIPGKPTNIRVR